jgi:hypothetical protein
LAYTRQHENISKTSDMNITHKVKRKQVSCDMVDCRGGQTRVNCMDPTDPYGSVLSGRVVMGGTGPTVIKCGLGRRTWVGCGCLHTTRRCP